MEEWKWKICGELHCCRGKRFAEWDSTQRTREDEENNPTKKLFIPHRLGYDCMAVWNSRRSKNSIKVESLVFRPLHCFMERNDAILKWLIPNTLPKPNVHYVHPLRAEQNGRACYWRSTTGMLLDRSSLLGYKTCWHGDGALMLEYVWMYKIGKIKHIRFEACTDTCHPQKRHRFADCIRKLRM